MLVTQEDVSVVRIKGILLNLEVKAKTAYASCLSNGKNQYWKMVRRWFRCICASTFRDGKQRDAVPFVH